jgi:hypothetical protein
VMDLDPKVCPEEIMWASDPRYAHKDLECVGFNGDRYYRPMATDGQLVPYTGTVMAIDPSGKGKDETVAMVLKAHAGRLFLMDFVATQGGFEPAVLRGLADLAKQWSVNHIVIEENFGQGMFGQLLMPVLAQVEHKCKIETVRHNKQKELRICDTLEPAISAHRLVVNTLVVRKDWESVGDYPPEEGPHYRLMHQLSRITRDRGALRHDDRLDCLAMAVAYWMEQLAQDAGVRREAADDKRRDQMFREFLKGAVGLPKKAKTTWSRGRSRPRPRRGR